MCAEAAARIIALANATAGAGRPFTVALSGGSTPRLLYETLAAPGYKDRIPWPRTYLFWGDERYVAPDHPDSNYRMVKAALLDNIPIPAANIFPMPTHHPEPATAAVAYEATLKAFFRLRGPERPRFGLILLGLGRDGHTASLFPRSPALAAETGLVVATDSPAAGGVRLTLTFPVINNAANILFLVTGGDKAAVLRETLTGDYRPDDIPAQRVRPADGSTCYLVDRQAAGE